MFNMAIEKNGYESLGVEVKRGACAIKSYQKWKIDSKAHCFRNYSSVLGITVLF
jgi:hypothetical protein